MPEKFPIVLSKSQRGALLLLLSFLFLIPALRLSDAERITEGQIQDRYADFQRLWKPLESNQKEPRVQSFTYNPNYLTDYRAYRWGFQRKLMIGSWSIELRVVLLIPLRNFNK